jgi:hypothetical protein
MNLPSGTHATSATVNALQDLQRDYEALRVVRDNTELVNGYDRHGGLTFSREVKSQADHDNTVAAAWRAPHVVRVVTEWPVG